MAVTELSHLANPLASSSLLKACVSQTYNVSRDLEDSIHYETTRLLQAAGILLHLPQEIIAHSIVVIQHFWVSQEGGNLLEHDAIVSTL